MMELDKEPKQDGFADSCNGSTTPPGGVIAACIARFRYQEPTSPSTRPLISRDEFFWLDAGKRSFLQRLPDSFQMPEDGWRSFKTDENSSEERSVQAHVVPEPKFHSILHDDDLSLLDGKDKYDSISVADSTGTGLAHKGFDATAKLDAYANNLLEKCDQLLLGFAQPTNRPKLTSSSLASMPFYDNCDNSSTRMSKDVFDNDDQGHDYGDLSFSITAAGSTDLSTVEAVVRRSLTYKMYENIPEIPIETGVPGIVPLDKSDGTQVVGLTQTWSCAMPCESWVPLCPAEGVASLVAQISSDVAEASAIAENGEMAHTEVDVGQLQPQPPFFPPLGGGAGDSFSSDEFITSVAGRRSEVRAVASCLYVSSSSEFDQTVASGGDGAEALPVQSIESDGCYSRFGQSFRDDSSGVARVAEDGMLFPVDGSSKSTLTEADVACFLGDEVVRLLWTRLSAVRENINR